MNTRQPTPGLVSLTYVIYGLHAFSAFSGILSPAFVLTAFLTGWPSIIAVILNYAKRSEAAGTYLESHMTWLIRTFWFAVLWLVLSGLLILSFFGIPVAIFVLCFTGIWVLYRIIRGLLCMIDEQAIAPVIIPPSTAE
ncbi:MAG TPA: hypothetical protein VIM96_08475 [Pseudomonadales bacterium]|jgi:uncharacterized membrane protein